MRIRRKRMLLTAAAVAGSVALYGCGGGDSGPDKTPFNQTDVDKAAADAKKMAEMEAAAAAAAMAEAGTAAAEAKKAMEAAAAAKMAAADAAKHAMTATLDKAMAMAAAANASTQSGNAAAAAKAARAAADKARTAAAGHQAARDAEASAKAAEKHAMEAEASATAAMRSYETAKSVKADRDATGVMATAAGAHAETARQQAAAADKAAKAAKAEVAKAKDATTVDAADAAKTAAMKALEDANKAYKAADASAKDAEKLVSDAAAVTMGKTEARTHANAAKESRDMAQMYVDYTTGYADARMAREVANAGKMDLASHKKLMDRVDWIKPATTTDTKLDDAAKAVRNAAEGLERTAIEEVIASRKGRLATALSMAEVERNRARNDLTAAKNIYNAAKPFSENGMGIDDDNLASGKTLRHTSGKISVDMDAARLYPSDLEITQQGPYDILYFGSVRSFGGIYTKTDTTTPVFAKYRMEFLGAQAVGPNLDKTGYHKYFVYGIWGEARDGFNLTTPSRLPNEVMTEINTFVFADPSNLTKNIPVTGSATFQTEHRSRISIYSGRKGAGASAGTEAVIGAGAIVPSGRVNAAGTKFNGYHTGYGVATIDFAKGKMNLTLNNTTGLNLPTNRGQMFYDLEGIDLDRSTGILSGGTYVGQRSGTGARTREADYNFFSDPFRTGAGATGTSYVPTVKLHGGLFGPQSNEIGGTIRLTATVPHGVVTAADAAKAEDGTITVDTGFAGINSSIP